MQRRFLCSLAHLSEGDGRVCDGEGLPAVDHPRLLQPLVHSAQSDLAAVVVTISKLGEQPKLALIVGGRERKSSEVR